MLTKHIVFAPCLCSYYVRRLDTGFETHELARSINLVRSNWSPAHAAGPALGNRSCEARRARCMCACGAMRLAFKESNVPSLSQYLGRMSTTEHSKRSVVELRWGWADHAPHGAALDSSVHSLQAARRLQIGRTYIKASFEPTSEHHAAREGAEGRGQAGTPYTLFQTCFASSTKLNFYVGCAPLGSWQRHIPTKTRKFR